MCSQSAGCTAGASKSLEPAGSGPGETGEEFMLHRALPAATAKTRLLLSGVAVLSWLVACGGAESGFVEGSASTLGAQAQTPVPPTRSGAAAATPVPSASAVKADATPMPALEPNGYDLHLYDEDGNAVPSLALVPVDGRGYPGVRLRVMLRGPRLISPVANVQAYCATPTRCEYLPSRNGDRALKYSVSIGEDSIARLSPSRDMIALTTRELKVAEPVAVTVTLTVEGQPPVSRQIKYLPSAS